MGEKVNFRQIIVSRLCNARIIITTIIATITIVIIITIIEGTIFVTILDPEVDESEAEDET